MRYREIKEGLTRAELEAHNEKIAQIKRNIEADGKGALTPRNTIAAWAINNPYAVDNYIEREFAKRELNRRKMPTNEKHIQRMMAIRKNRVKAIWRKHQNKPTR